MYPKRSGVVGAEGRGGCDELLQCLWAEFPLVGNGIAWLGGHKDSPPFRIIRTTTVVLSSTRQFVRYY